MKLDQLSESLKPGTYAGLRFDPAVAKSLEQFCLSNDIPNHTPVDKLHITLLYSKKHLPNYEAQGDIDPAYMAHPDKFIVWQTNGENKPQSNCLILKLKSRDITDRHNALMKEHDATYDHPLYEPHVTLSYDIGDMDIEKLKIGDIEQDLPVVTEYQEDLKTDWASKL